MILFFVFFILSKIKKYYKTQKNPRINKNSKNNLFLEGKPTPRKQAPPVMNANNANNNNKVSIENCTINGEIHQLKIFPQQMQNMQNAGVGAGVVPSNAVSNVQNKNARISPQQQQGFLFLNFYLSIPYKISLILSLLNFLQFLFPFLKIIPKLLQQ